MNIPKKHHFLPQFYLEFFKIVPQTGKYAHIWQTEKSASPKSTKPAIKDTGCKRDYHTLDFQDQDRDRKTIEGMLSILEAEQANLVNKICKTNQVLGDAKFPLAEFITTMRFRVPAFKRHIESTLKGVLQSTFKILMHQGKLPPMPKKLNKLFQEKGYDFLQFNISNWKILQHMLDMAFGSDNSAIMKEMKCQLILAPNGHHFITADSPVAIYHPNYESIRPYGVGPAFKEVEITFPIAKSHLVKLSWHGKDGTFHAGENQMMEYNRRTIIMADKYIYSCESQKHLAKQIALNQNIEAGYQLDNLCYGEGSIHISRFIPVTK
jgi:hypothetical protein